MPKYERAIVVLYVCLFLKYRLNDTIKINLFLDLAVRFCFNHKRFECTIFRFCDTLKNLDKLTSYNCSIKVRGLRACPIWK